MVKRLAILEYTLAAGGGDVPLTLSAHALTYSSTMVSEYVRVVGFRLIISASRLSQYLG